MGTVGSSVSFNMIQFLLVVSLGGLSFGGTPICNTIWEEKCWDEPREQCTTVLKPYTSTYYEDECKTVKVPKMETVPEKNVALLLSRSVPQSTRRCAMWSTGMCVTSSTRTSVRLSIMMSAPTKMNRSVRRLLRPKPVL